MDHSSYSLAISPCPNDTYIFCALINGYLPATDFTIKEVAFHDIDLLNSLACEGSADIIKLSFHAYGVVQDRYSLLSAGAALGRGCGPLLIQKKGQKTSLTEMDIAIPGDLTTAAALLRLYLPEAKTQVLRFDAIMPAIATGQVDAGVIIHESRFTYEQYDLEKIVDLGAWWEEETDCPIPLGGIAVSNKILPEMQATIAHAIQKSITWAQTNPDQCLPFIQQYAQEMEPPVLQSHIKLYVNEFTKNLGSEGKKAIDVFLKKGHDAGLF